MSYRHFDGKEIGLFSYRHLDGKHGGQLAGGQPPRPDYASLQIEDVTEQEAAAWMMKVGHDGQGRMPIDVFVRRLFTGEAHVMSLEGARQGAFPRDKTRRYEDYCWA